MKADWGLTAREVDASGVDITPRGYFGEQPPVGLTYLWRPTRLAFRPVTDEYVSPRLTINAELVPGSKEQKQYAGFPVTNFISIKSTNDMIWLSFILSMGITPSEFLDRCVVDESNGRVIRCGSKAVPDALKVFSATLTENNYNDSKRVQLSFPRQAPPKNERERKPETPAEESWENASPAAKPTPERDLSQARSDAENALNESSEYEFF